MNVPDQMLIKDCLLTLLLNSAECIDYDFAVLAKNHGFAILSHSRSEKVGKGRLKLYGYWQRKSLKKLSTLLIRFSSNKQMSL